MTTNKIIVLPGDKKVVITSGSIAGPIEVCAAFGKFHVRWGQADSCRSGNYGSREEADAVASILIDAWSEFLGLEIEDHSKKSEVEGPVITNGWLSLPGGPLIRMCDIVAVWTYSYCDVNYIAIDTKEKQFRIKLPDLRTALAYVEAIKEDLL